MSAVRSVGGHDVEVGDEGTPGVEGLLRRFERAPVPVAALLGMRPVAVAAGAVTFALTTAPEHANPVGALHGGVLATLLDSAMGCAVQTTLPKGITYTTLQLNVHYTRGATTDGAELRCTGTVVHTGRTQATAEGRVVDSNGRLVAHATTTCLVLTPRQELTPR